MKCLIVVGIILYNPQNKWIETGKLPLIVYIQRSETDTILFVWFQKVVDALVHRLNSPDSSRCHVLCLKTLRMFSREKDKLVNMVSEITIATIMKMTGLNHYAVEEGDLIEIQNGDPEGK